MVSSGAPTSLDLLTHRGQLILSGEETNSMPPGVECMSLMRSMRTPIVAMSSDAHSLLCATWRSGRMLRSM
jgi:hypothetical protein